MVNVTLNITIIISIFLIGRISVSCGERSTGHISILNLLASYFNVSSVLACA